MSRERKSAAESMRLDTFRWALFKITEGGKKRHKQWPRFPSTGKRGWASRMPVSCIGVDAPCMAYLHHLLQRSALCW